MRLALTLVATLALAACGQAGEPEAQPAQEDAASPKFYTMTPGTFDIVG